MFTFYNMPSSYQPLDSLKICSNLIRGGGFPFAIKDVPPVIIGMGSLPSVWLQAPNPSSYRNFTLLVDNNISTVQEISVVADFFNKEINIFFNNHLKILSVNIDGYLSAEITHLDLRPLGFNITGDRNGMDVSGSKFTGNRIQGTTVFMNLD